jgi:hypothetical protein
MPKNDAANRLMDALNGAIGDQSRTYMAKVVSTANRGKGRIEAYSETHGNIQVMCRVVDKLQPGDAIMVRKSAPDKYAPFIYAGFGQGTDGSQQPGTDPSAPVNVYPPADDGSGTAASGTLQFYLDGITAAIKTMKGTSAWDTDVAQTLTQAINWRAPVSAAVNLPTIGNRIGDVRYVISTNSLYVWTSSGWRSPTFSESAGAEMALMQASVSGISSFTCVARTTGGIVPADVMNTAHIGNVAGITTESGGGSQDVIVQLSGVVIFPTAVFGASRGPVMIGPAGSLVFYLPVGATFVQQAGVVVGQSELFLNLDTTLITL